MLILCGKKQQERNEKRTSYEENQRKEAADLFNTATVHSADTEEENDGDTENGDNSDVQMSKELGEASGYSKRRKYQPAPGRPDDPLPFEMRHVRYSERCVRDDIYRATTDLIGIGLSPREALAAVEVVANRCFGREFHQSEAPPEAEEIQFIPLDQNTLPNERSVRDMAERVEAEGLAEAKEIITRSKQGDIITCRGFNYEEACWKVLCIRNTCTQRTCITSSNGSSCWRST